jgi:segregation and condensation protein A
VRRLLEYQHVKEIALWMSRTADRHALKFPRGYLPAPPELPPPPLTLDLVELLSATERVIQGILHPVLHRVVARPLDVESATLRLHALLADREEISWWEALGPRPTLVDVLSTLLALLELARRGQLTISQSQPFTPPVIRRESAFAAH